VPTGQLGAIFCLLQILIGLDLRRDVTSSASIAREAPILDVCRHAADAHVTRKTVQADPVVAAITKRPMGGRILAMLFPLFRRTADIVQFPSPVADVVAGPQRVCCRGQRDVVLILAERLPCDHPEQQDERGRQHDLRALCPWAAIDRVIVWCENVRRYAVSGAMIRLSV
jgi:hypothetical protein